MISSLNTWQKRFLLVMGLLFAAFAVGVGIFHLYSIWWYVVPAIMIFGVYTFFLGPVGIGMAKTLKSDLRQIRRDYPRISRSRQVAVWACLLFGGIAVIALIAVLRWQIPIIIDSTRSLLAGG